MSTNLRNHYESQLLNLRQLAKEPASDATALSNRELLIAINGYLKRYNCDTWTAEEIIAEEGKMEREKQAFRSDKK